MEKNELDIIMTDTEFTLLEQHYKQKLLKNPTNREARTKLSTLYVFKKMFWKAELLWIQYGEQLDSMARNQTDENGKVINIEEEVCIATNENKQVINKEIRFKAKRIKEENEALNLENKTDYIIVQQLYETLLGLNIDKKEIFLKLSKICWLSGNFDKASKYLEEYFALEKDHTKMTIYVIDLYEKLGKSKRAKEIIQNAIDVNPNNLDLRFKLSQMYLKDKQLEEAKQELIYILIQNPNSIPAIFAMGKLYAIKENNEEKQKVYDIILDNLPEEILLKNFDKKARTEFINMHNKNKQINKNNFGVFNGNHVDKITSAMAEIILKKVTKIEEFKEADVYCVPIEKAGINMREK